MQDVLGPRNISDAEYMVLFALKRNEGITSAEISRWAGVTAQAGNQIVNALVGKDLVVRTRDPDHGSRLLISLSPSGKTLIAACELGADSVEDTMCQDMTAAERETLLDLLHRAAASLGQPISQPLSA